MDNTDGKKRREREREAGRRVLFGGAVRQSEAFFFFSF
jgi:hypothetical protein